MKVLVTGGAGFIGSTIVASLAEQGADVIVYDNLSSGFRENVPRLPNVSFVEGDILDPRALTKAIAGVDAVSHQAAQLEITTGIENPAADLRVNTEGVLNVLQAMVETGVNRLLYASSACVYGQAQYTPQDEGHPTNPNWQYGVSKLASEKYCQIYAQSFGIRFTAFRYAIVHGPREYYGRVLSIFLKRLSQGLPPVVFGEGNQLRDLVYVGDLVAMHNRCLQDDRAVNQIFNVSTGRGITIRNLAHLVCRISGTGLQPETEEVPVGGYSKVVEGRDGGRQRLPSELRTMILDPSKAMAALGWVSSVPLEESLAREWAWLQANPDRWKAMHY